VSRLDRAIDYATAARVIAKVAAGLFVGAVRLLIIPRRRDLTADRRF
jgi:hypothetical protein